MKKKICFVIVNRANYGRIRRLILAVKKNKKFQVQVILMSSPLLNKYGELEQLLKLDKITVDYKIFSHVEGENHITMVKSTALALMDLPTAYSNLKPDYIFLVGDRFEALSAAIAASFMNIFLIHLQGGELSGSIDENIRHSITKLSHLHFVCTERAKKILIRMGENPKDVFNVGCPSIDEIRKINFNQTINLKKYNYGVGFKVDLKKPYFVVALHPVTTNFSNKELILNTLEAIIKLNQQTIWLWPNNDADSKIISKYIRRYREVYKNLKINFYKNFKPVDYLKVIKKSECLIGNSSSGIRESSYLGVPVVNIGTRQNLRERGKNVVDCSLKVSNIISSVKKIKNKKIIKSNVYGSGNSVAKITKILNILNSKIEKKFYGI